MKPEDMKQFPLLQTRSTAEAMKDEATLMYVIDCVNRFYKGDYGTVCAEDTEANNNDLQCGYGHVLARYEQAHKLESDIYIEAHFDLDHLADVNYTQTMIMYPFER